MNEQEFREKAKEKGWGEPQIRAWQPNLNKEMHTHEKSAMAYVIAGKLTLVYEHRSEAFGIGEWCERLAGTVHTETTAAEGSVTLLGYN